MSKQPRDEANYPIPVLNYKRSSGQQIVLSPISAISSAFGSSTRVISAYSTVDCFFEIGDITTVANLTDSHFLPAGVYIDISLGSDYNALLNSKHIAALSEGEGTLYISERI
jgi:hypothetical protein